MVAEHMQRTGEQPADSPAEKRNLMSVAHTSAVSGRCGAWRIIASAEQKENFKGDEQPTEYATERVVKVGTELPGVRDGIFALMDENLRKAAIRKVRKTVEVPQVQNVDEINVPVVAQSQVPVVRNLQKTVEVPQSQFPDRVVDVPVVMQRQDDAVEHIIDVPVTRRRVFIVNDRDELIPKWFNVVKGVVASEDLPLNVYRETLLQNKILRVIKKNHVTKYLEMLADTAELKDDWKKLHERFVKCMKLGIRENSVDDVETAELLRFNTFKPEDEEISFEEYVDRTKEGQNDIYCITSESIAMVSSSSFLENLRKNGHEVPYMADSVDEYAVHQPKDFDGRKLKPTMKEGLDLRDQN